MSVGYDVILVGLGKIGAGEGEYSQRLNSHLSSLLRANWVRALFVDDINAARIDEAVGFSSKVFSLRSHVGELRGSTNPKLFVDSTSSNDRCAMISDYAADLSPNLIFCEKPIKHESWIDYKRYPWSAVRVNYPRAAFKSTLILKKNLRVRPLKIDVRFNNGVLNVIPHFLNYLSIFFPLSSRDVGLNTSVVGRRVDYDYVSFDYVDSPNNIFEFDVFFNEGIFRYRDFGRRMSFNSKDWRLSEIDHRFRWIYDSVENVFSMPSLESDAIVMDISKKIAEEFSE